MKKRTSGTNQKQKTDRLKGNGIYNHTESKLKKIIKYVKNQVLTICYLLKNYSFNIKHKYVN